tara:strand:- start:113 stop:1108 length:996 start_codon:yes stop_codon:yes gene_type:complete
MIIRFLLFLFILSCFTGCDFLDSKFHTPYSGYYVSDWTLQGDIITNYQAGEQTEHDLFEQQDRIGTSNIFLIDLSSPELEDIIMSKKTEFIQHDDNPEWEVLFALSSFIDSNNDRYTAYISLPFNSESDDTLKFYRNGTLLSRYLITDEPIYRVESNNFVYDEFIRINPFTKQSFLFSFGYTKLYIFSITGDLEHELDFGSHAIWKTATSFWYYDPIQNTLASYDLETATSTMYDIDFKPSYYNDTDNTLQTIDNGVLKTFSVASNTITASIAVTYDYKTLNEFKFSPDGSKLLVYEKGWFNEFRDSDAIFKSLGINIYDINTHTLTKIRD